MKNEFIITLNVLALVSGVASDLRAAPPAAEIMRKLEYNMEITRDIRARVEMTQQKADQGTRKIEMIYYRRDSDDSFLIVMSAPESEKGNGYLRVGDNFWMYRSNTRTFQHVNRDESIGGSDAHGSDFEKRKLTELYEPVKGSDGTESVTEEMLGKIPVYRFGVTARVNDVDYPRKTYWVRRDNCLPLKEQSYSLSGTLMQTAYMRKYTVIEGRYVAIEMLFIDEFEKGNRTLVEISGISVNRLENYLFTKPYLENLSK
jgi:hypothetical protein